MKKERKRDAAAMLQREKTDMYANKKIFCVHKIECVYSVISFFNVKIYMSQLLSRNNGNEKQMFYLPT